MTEIPQCGGEVTQKRKEETLWESSSRQSGTKQGRQAACASPAGGAVLMEPVGTGVLNRVGAGAVHFHREGGISTPLTEACV